MISALGKAFAALLAGCYKIIPDYGWSIIFFTLLSKVILIPISVMVQFNSIKMVKMYPEMNRIKAKFFGNSDMISEENYNLYKKENYHPMLDLVPVIVQLIVLMGVVEGLKRFNVSDTMFCGFDLSLIPAKVMGRYILVPLIAAFSAWFMCYIQNVANVLQSEQGKVNKYTTMGISVGLSLYLGFFVPAGVALYWTIGNLLAVVQLFILKACINPKKYIDYERLEKAKKDYEEIEKIGKKSEVSKEDRKRERADYKRFFSIGNKHLVFYSESNGFYKYFKGIIEYILENTNIVVHYITSDPKDNIFKLAESNPRIKPYFIGENKLITLMMKMDADIVCMTTPDLENYHIKRSYIRKDIEYIYIQHHVGSINMILRKGAVDHFDTVFVSGKHQKEEIEATERCYGLAAKKLVEYGYPLLDEMISEYAKLPKKTANEQKMILIAPSWHSQGIMFTCIEELIDGLKGNGWKVILRPHPQFVRHNRNILENLARKYEDDRDIEIQFDFTSNNPVLAADLVVTDWSAIAYEYSFTTFKPVLYVDVPMKVNNPDWKEAGVEPIDIWIRDRNGISISPDKLDNVANEVKRLFLEGDKYREDIGHLREEYIYNIGSSAEYGAKYIISSLQEKIELRKGNVNNGK